MDLIIGIVIGVSVTLLAAIIYRKVTKPTQATRPELKVTPDERYNQLSSDLIYDKGKSIETARSFLDELEEAKPELESKDYESLRAQTLSRIESFEREIKEREEAQPKLAAFKELRNWTDPFSLFRELHKINVTGDGIISYDELDAYGTKEDVRWLVTNHEHLLIERLKELLLRARGGDRSALASARILIESLKDFESEEGERSEAFINRTVGREWDEALVRIQPDCSLDDIRSCDEMEDDELREIIRRARIDQDLLSIKLTLLFVEYDDYYLKILGQEVQKDLERCFQQLHPSLGVISTT